MGKHCSSCTCNNNKEIKWIDYPCEYCGSLCKKRSKRALCSLKCRLLGNIKKENDCMLWQGKIGVDGYGLIMIDRKRKRVSRVCYELFKGLICDKMLVCHTCDNPPCINPDHLFIGTHEDNMKDMALKGRSKKKLNP